MTVNQELLNIGVSHAVYLENLKDHVVTGMADLMDELVVDLFNQIKKDLGVDISRATWTIAYQRAMHKSVQNLLSEYAPILGDYLDGKLKPVAAYESKFWAKALTDTVPIKWSVAQPSPQQLWAAVTAKPFEGRLLKDHVAGFADTVQQDLAQAIRLGFAEGEAIPSVVRRIREIIPGIEGFRARSLARTAVQHTAAVARDRTFEENADLIKGEEWVATLDSRTTVLCASRDGKIYPLGEAPPIPAHWQCRSTKVPVIKSWEELGLDPGEVKPETRASLDGYQPASLKYEQWLQMQPEELQKRVLGIRRWELWKGGKPIEEFVIDRTKTIRLAELARIEKKVDLVEEIPHGIDGAERFGGRLQRDPQAPRLGGSTGAFVAVDDEGAQWIVKQYGGNQLQVQNEWIANRLYHLGGAQVPEARLAKFEGQLGIATRRLPPGYTTIGSAGATKAAGSALIRRKFVLDAYLANWDTVGLQFDNMLWKAGKVSTLTRIDQGGALLFRAQGAPKGAAFGKQVLELQTLRDPAKNAAAAKVFAKVADEDIIKAINTLQSGKVFSQQALWDVLQASGMETAKATEIYKVLEARWAYLLKWRNQAKQAAKIAQELVAQVPLGPVKFTPTNAAVGAQHMAAPRTANSQQLNQLVDEVYNRRLLTSGEQAALRHYTASGYQSMNRSALRGQATADLDTAIAKLPTYTGVYGRGIPNMMNMEQKWAKWTSGEWAYVEWPAYSSCTVVPGREWSDLGGYKAVIMGKGRTPGGWIGRRSSHPSEAEYILNRGAKFRVAGYAESGTRRTLLLQEVDDPNAIPVSQAPPKKLAYEELMKIWRDDYAKM
jgi:SPP1 gp7 family putative phage head morphogenesis protein